MDALFLYAGQRFRWDMEKADLNFARHGIRFEQACEVFLDPLVKFLDATAEDEAREAVLGLAEDWSLLFVVHVIREPGVIRIISARPATRAERNAYEDQS
jgi:uncharacterized DUF497 family protein